MWISDLCKSHFFQTALFLYHISSFSFSHLFYEHPSLKPPRNATSAASISIYFSSDQNRRQPVLAGWRPHKYRNLLAILMIVYDYHCDFDDCIRLWLKVACMGAFTLRHIYWAYLFHLLLMSFHSLTFLLSFSLHLIQTSISSLNITFNQPHVSCNRHSSVIYIQQTLKAINWDTTYDAKNSILKPYQSQH